MDEAGEIILEQKVATTPEAMKQTFEKIPLTCCVPHFGNHVLGELYKLLAADKISPRPGAVMAYTCSLLLRTLPAIDDELEPEAPKFVFDLPRPQGD